MKHIAVVPKGAHTEEVAWAIRGQRGCRTGRTSVRPRITSAKPKTGSTPIDRVRGGLVQSVVVTS